MVLRNSNMGHGGSYGGCFCMKSEVKIPKFYFYYLPPIFITFFIFLTFIGRKIVQLSKTWCYSINPDSFDFCISLWIVHLRYFLDDTRFIFRARNIFRAGEQGADKWLNYLGFNRVFNPSCFSSISSEI